MTETPDSFNAFRATWVLLTVALWVFTCLGLLFNLPPTQDIYPSIYVFSTTLLLLIGLVFKTQASACVALSFKKTSFKWLLIALTLALFLWFFDHWLVQILAPGELNNDIEQWHQSIKGYSIISVAIGTILMAPLVEELFFRGLLLNTLKAKLNKNASILLSALMFALIHWKWPEFIGLYCVAVIYGWMSIKSGSVLPSICAHVIHNALTFWLYVSS